MLLITPKDFLEHLTQADGAEAPLAEVFGRCNALAPDQRIAWQQFDAQYKAFSLSRRARWSGWMAIPFLTMNAFDFAALRDDDTQLIVFERSLVEWQQIAARTCGAQVPPIIPRDSPDHPSNEPGQGLFGGGLDTSTKVLIGVGLVTVLVLALKR